MSQQLERIEAESQTGELRPGTRKPYRTPEITLELALETRAGTPLHIPDPLNPFGLEP